MATSQTHGTALLTCRNHPTYRWTKTHHVESGASPYMGSGHLMFDGEEGGKPGGNILSYSEKRLAEKPQEFQDWYREHYTPECNCPSSDLVFLRWIS